MSLAERFRIHGTDKFTHGYAPVYERELAGTVPRVMLEIGVETGASLVAWLEGASGDPGWPEVRVYGIDTNSTAGYRARHHPRCHILHGDARTPDPAVRDGFLGRFDLIVDDGSHVPEDQIAVCQAWWVTLAPGGLYVIEDVAPGDAGVQLQQALATAQRTCVIEDTPGLEGWDNDRVAILRHVRPC